MAVVEWGVYVHQPPNKRMLQAEQRQPLALLGLIAIRGQHELGLAVQRRLVQSVFLRAEGAAGVADAIPEVLKQPLRKMCLMSTEGASENERSVVPLDEGVDGERAYGLLVSSDNVGGCPNGEGQA